MSVEKKYYYITSLDKGLRVLELLAEHGSMSVSQIGAALGYNRAGAHRFVSTLKDLGYVHQNEDSKYELSFKILELSTKLARRFEIRKSASSHMRRLSAAFHETINLGFLDQQDVVHLDKIDSLELLRPDPEIGSRAPAHLTALGKAILAFLPSEELEHFLRNVNWTSQTPKGCTSPEAFQKQCQRIQKLGYAMDDEELCMGLRCVAVPIFDHRHYPRYAISISGPTMRMSSQRMEKMSAELLKVGKSLSHSLGHVGC